MGIVLGKLGIPEGRDCSNFIRLDFQQKLDPSLTDSHPLVVSPDFIKQVSECWGVCATACEGM